MSYIDGKRMIFGGFEQVVEVEASTAVRRSRTGFLASSRESVTLYFREEPGAGKPHAGICAGGGK